ncbi:MULTISPECIES: hypothetical protein [Archaeoglobus]|jgi:hypothetical protein|uniref:Uncharacterized protein AF_0523 n=3 Tax=Archaeoglobus fulgidus TaxID=2234 RepID=Y523_ARCFU|nr:MULTISPECIES: hypothetical protein [Archaeoglobus]O29727.1 RecName: Full=Uncharacterized protein AF_0523 [Archaeoglobus fulgidus DSM 4304]AAB90730.1 predicted coding region AF_0523 [Archaeoglobus fulgidus DSM 4304]AIG97340.1 hypothetical protein AFULGI_00005320 [Archaeoglobus fulgidus DSM 8774]KUJ93586.1 MAG: hypothetical protein XD40_1220 [Archaeoglobus fulgidus]KUK07153.1 MAG: Uncharacterized protein XD48_0611 [Archaeoglobus fulgidus]MDI3496957.1 hypothetical protein [Archaeoglobus sp.]
MSDNAKTSATDIVQRIISLLTIILLAYFLFKEGLFSVDQRLLSLATIVLLASFLFIIFLVLFKWPLGNLNKKEIRRTIAIVTTSFYFGTLSMVLSGKLELTEEVGALIDGLKWAFMVVVAFYFGSRAVEDALKSKKSAEECPQNTDAEAG